MAELSFFNFETLVPVNANGQTSVDLTTGVEVPLARFSLNIAASQRALFRANVGWAARLGTPTLIFRVRQNSATGKLLYRGRQQAPFDTRYQITNVIHAEEGIPAGTRSFYLTVELAEDPIVGYVDLNEARIIGPISFVGSVIGPNTIA